MVYSAVSRKIWNLSAASLAFLLFALSLAMPLHLATHVSGHHAHAHPGCGVQGDHLITAASDGIQRHGDDACAICQGGTRIAALLTGVSSGMLEAPVATDPQGNLGTLHASPMGRDSQRGPPQEDFPVFRA